MPAGLLESSFLVGKTVTDMSGNYFLKTDLILASGSSFSSQRKPFSSIASDIFQDVSANTFFSSKEKVLCLTQKFFLTASGNYYLDYREAY